MVFKNAEKYSSAEIFIRRKLQRNFLLCIEKAGISVFFTDTPASVAMSAKQAYKISF